MLASYLQYLLMGEDLGHPGKVGVEQMWLFVFWPQTSKIKKSVSQNSEFNVRSQINGFNLLCIISSNSRQNTENSRKTTVLGNESAQTQICLTALPVYRCIDQSVVLLLESPRREAEVVFYIGEAFGPDSPPAGL